MGARPSGSDSLHPDLSVGHAFGPVELNAGIGDLAGLAIRTNTGSIPAVVSLGATFTAPQLDHSYAYGQYLSLAHKLVLSPHRLALFGEGGIELVERSSTTDPDMLVPAHIVSGYGTAEAEIQLLPRLGLYAGASATAPIVQSSTLAFRASLTPFAQLLLAFGTWDLFAGINVDDVTRSPSAFVLGGVSKRWGR